MSDDQPKTHKCPRCDFTCSEDELENGEIPHHAVHVSSSFLGVLRMPCMPPIEDYLKSTDSKEL